jgi:hypothetical protein
MVLVEMSGGEKSMTDLTYCALQNNPAQNLQEYAPSHTRVQEMATRILRMNGDIERLGEAWIQKYI